MGALKAAAIAGGGAAGDEQAQARRGQVADAAADGGGHGGELDERPFPADGFAGGRWRKGRRGSGRAWSERGLLPSPEGDGLHVVGGFLADEALAEGEDDAGEQAAERGDGEAAPGAQFIEDGEAGAGMAGEEVLEGGGGVLKRAGPWRLRGRRRGRPRRDF